jgi:hypothetical protein
MHSVESSFRPGDLVSINQPLDPTRFGGRVAQVIRLGRRSGADAALVTGGECPIGPPSAYPSWAALHHLHHVDNETYQAWSSYQRTALHAARRGYRPAPTSLEQRELERAPYRLAVAEVLTERWRASGILPAEAGQPAGNPQPWGQYAMFDGDLGCELSTQDLHGSAGAPSSLAGRRPGRRAQGAPRRA